MSEREIATDAGLTRLEWEDHPNPLAATLHVNVDLSLGPGVVLMLRSIPGVESISMGRYWVTAIKGMVFSWDEIRPNVEAVVRQWFANQAG